MTTNHDAHATAAHLLEQSSMGGAGVRAVARRTPGALSEQIGKLAASEALLFGKVASMAIPATAAEHALTKAIELHGGRAIGERDGEQVAWFEDARDAFAAGIEASGPHLRLAVHAYTSRDAADGPPTSALDEVSIVGKAAHGGQVLASLAASGSVGELLPRDAVLADAGQLLADLSDEPRPIFKLVHSTLHGTFPPLRPFRRPPGQLPQPDSELVGREDDLEALARKLRPGRLVTLTGEAGTGKTRLALEVARRAATSAFPDGVRFCDASTISTVDDLVGHLGVAFGRPSVAGHQWDAPNEPTSPGSTSGATPSSTSSATGHLRRDIVESLEGRLLLVLDGCDGLRDEAAALIGTMLHPDGQATVLATSRAPLGVADETEVEVGRLRSSPPTTGEPAPATVLLVQLARSRGVDADADDPMLADVARRLDAVPLAIELVAPLLGELTAGELAARLAGLGPEDDPAAHRTLTAALDLALSLLPDDDLRLFAALSTFSGGWGFDGAESVASAAGLDPATVPSALTRLTRRALVRVEVPPGGGVARYRMVDAIRSRVADRPDLGDWRSSAAGAHAVHFLALTRAAVAPRRTALEPAWVRQIEDELDNVRTAQRWFVEQGRHGEALEMIWHLADDVLMRGRGDIGRWAEALGTDPATAGHRLRPAALALASNTAFVQGELPRAERLANASIDAAAAAATAEAPGDGFPGRWIALNTLALVATSTNDDETCRLRLREVVAEAEANGDHLALATAHYERVHLHWQAGHPARGRGPAAALRLLAQEETSPSIAAMAALAEGMTEAHESPGDARRHLDRGMALAWSARSTLLVFHGWRAAHRLALSSRDRVEAARRLHSVAEEFRVRGNTIEQMQTTIDIVWHLLEMEAYETAEVICGHLSQTQFRYVDRFRLAERRLHKRPLGWVSTPQDRREAREAGAAMTPTMLATFVGQAIHDLERT